MLCSLLGLSVSVNSDLELLPTCSNMLLTFDTTSCHDDNFCQIIFESHQFSNEVIGQTQFWNAQTKVLAVTSTFDLVT